MVFADAMWRVPTGQADPAPTGGFDYQGKHIGLPQRVSVYTDTARCVPTGGGIRGRVVQRPYLGGKN